MAELTFQDVLNILRLIDSGTFSNMQIEFEGTRLNVTRRANTGAGRVGREPDRRGPQGPAAQPAIAATLPSAKPAPRVSQEVGEAPDALAPGTSAEYPNRVEVKPPMTGTYYAAPAPNAPPFVHVGSAVKTGDQLGVVEVMKLFTPVPSPCDGIIREILVGNEEFVASDQPLMIIQADA